MIVPPIPYRSHYSSEEKQQALIGSLGIKETIRALMRWREPIAGIHEYEFKTDPNDRCFREVVSCWDRSPQRNPRWQIVLEYRNGGRHNDFDRIASGSRMEKSHASGQTSWETVGSTGYLKLTGLGFVSFVGASEFEVDLRNAVDLADQQFEARSAAHEAAISAARKTGVGDDIPY